MAEATECQRKWGAESAFFCFFFFFFFFLFFLFIIFIFIFFFFFFWFVSPSALFGRLVKVSVDIQFNSDLCIVDSPLIRNMQMRVGVICIFKSMAFLFRRCGRVSISDWPWPPAFEASGRADASMGWSPMKMHIDINWWDGWKPRDGVMWPRPAEHTASNFFDNNILFAEWRREMMNVPTAAHLSLLNSLKYSFLLSFWPFWLFHIFIHSNDSSSFLTVKPLINCYSLPVDFCETFHSTC